MIHRDDKLRLELLRQKLRRDTQGYSFMPDSSEYDVESASHDAVNESSIVCPKDDRFSGTWSKGSIFNGGTQMRVTGGKRMRETKFEMKWVVMALLDKMPTEFWMS